NQKNQFPPQHQNQQPGLEHKMNPEPEYWPFYPGINKFKDQVVLISGGDSGIGRAISLAFANEGANISIIYKNEDEDAIRTKYMVESFGVRCMIIPGDAGEKDFCFDAVDKTFSTFSRLDILINNAAEQHIQEDFQDITEMQLE